MKIIKVPIFTDEYKIIVAIGKNKELAKYLSKNLEDWSYSEALKQCEKTRGSAYNRLIGTECKHPIITLNGDMPYTQALCTLPHEASHAIGFIMDFIGIDDRNGEFMGHGISSVMRHCNKIIFKNVKKASRKMVARPESQIRHRSKN